jgi:hypothetical protein
VLTDSSGNWSASIVSAGCTAVPINVQALGVGADQTAANAVQTTLTSRTTTAVAGSATLPQNTTVVLGANITPNKKAAANTTIIVEAWCQ